jgi:hypothetical protein
MKMDMDMKIYILDNPPLRCEWLNGKQFSTCFCFVLGYVSPLDVGELHVWKSS